MQQWEYAQVRYSHGTGAHRSVSFTHGTPWAKVADNYLGLLRQLGEEGWEMIQSNVSGDGKVVVAIFKRPRIATTDEAAIEASS